MSIGTGAAATVEISRIEYEGKCATCHGVTGKGDDEQAASGVIKESDSLDAFEHRRLVYELQIIR